MHVGTSFRNNSRYLAHKFTELRAQVWEVERTSSQTCVRYYANLRTQVPTFL